MIIDDDGIIVSDHSPKPQQLCWINLLSHVFAVDKMFVSSCFAVLSLLHAPDYQK